MQAQQTLMVMAGRNKATGQRVWAVQSTSQTKAAGHLVFHILTWDANAAAWVCGCPSRKPCIHMRLASDASKAEQERADAAFDALTTTYDCERPRNETTAQFYVRVAGVNPYDLTEDDFSRYMGYEYLAGGARRDAVTLWQQQARAADPQIAKEMSDSNHRYGDFSPYFRAVKRATQPKPAEPIMARNDSGPRLYRQPPVLAERVREVM